MPSLAARPPADPFELTNASGLRLQLGAGGELLAVRHGTVLINQVIPSPVENGLMRLVARRLAPEPEILPLLGPGAAPERGEISGNAVRWAGRSREIEHEVTLLLRADTPVWFWRVRLRNAGASVVRLDVLYGQDLGLAHPNAVRNNEAYFSQYIDHLPLDAPALGAVVLSRQNQAQAEGKFPWIAQGCLAGAASYSTDGYDFFGRKHRVTGVPAAWSAAVLPSRRRQYEFAYVALQSRPFELAPGEERTVTFFACFEPDHPAASSVADLETVLARVAEPPRPAPVRATWTGPFPPTIFQQAPPLAGRELSRGELAAFFPGPWRHVEDRDGELLSFFHGEGRHAVTQAKERLVERPQGHLLYSGAGLWPEPDVLGTTVYAAGIFNAQVFLGNTNLARFLSVVRNALNVVRASGQRVFVRLDDRWRQLGAPSVFDLGPNDARWIYDLGDRVIEARTACQPDRPAVTLELRVLRGEPVEWLVTHHLALGADELTMPQPLVIDTAGGAIGCLAASDGLLARSRPGTGLAIVVDAPESVAQLGGGELLGGGEDRAPVPFAVVQVRAVAHVRDHARALLRGWPPLGEPRPRAARRAEGSRHGAGSSHAPAGGPEARASA
ncbi:MAG: hypothetical protein WDO13_09815 [Verrucomicrobiota bacterium]